MRKFLIGTILSLTIVLGVTTAPSTIVKAAEPETAKDEDYIYVQQSEFALLYYAEENVPQYEWTYKLPTVIDDEPEEDNDFYSEDVRQPFRLTKHILNKKITYYKIEYYH